MRVTQAFRFELDPTASQRVALAKHVGAARFAYNWGLARSLEALERGERIPTAVDLHRQWNVWKRANAPWWVEVSKCAPQEAFRDLERAFNLRQYDLVIASNHPTGSSPGSHACGDPSGGGTAKVRSTSHGSGKQEAEHGR